jgi:hypothetical protein
MSLVSAITDLAALAPKAAGHLIRPQDWNTLIAALGEYGAALTAHDADVADLKARVAALEGSLAAVSAQVTALDGRLDALDEQVQPLLGQYLVTLSCSKPNFAMGEQCELTARVTSLTGQPLAAPFPWVDFVAAWGRLRARAGFITRAGASDNSLSVQVNAQGIARVLVRAEHTEGFSEDEELQISAVLEMMVPAQTFTVAQAIMAAPTPTDTRAKAAYQVINAQYRRADSIALRSFADTYHARTPEWSLQPLKPSFTTRWRDHRATVLAFAKPDADPTTADGARGSASIQLNFRDWLGPWAFDFVTPTPEVVGPYLEALPPVFEMADPLRGFKEYFDLEYTRTGLLGKKQLLGAMEVAMGRVNPGPDPRVQGAKEQILIGLEAQAASELYGAAGGAPKALDAQVRQSQHTGAVAKRVDEVDGKVGQTQGLVESVNVLEGRMQASERLGQNIQTGLTAIDANVRAINPLSEDSLKANIEAIGAQIASIRARVGG